DTARLNGSGGIALVQSVIDTGLEGLDTLSRHATVVGISDRSRGPAIPLAAISRGACIVEKRFALRADASAPCAVGLAAGVRNCEQAWASLAPDRRWSVN